MNKKGISPLIATVLIIGFTIVLAAVVMQWGGGFVRQLTEQQAQTTTTVTECMQLSFDLNSATYPKDVTVPINPAASGNVIFKVTNNADKIIGSFVVLLSHSDGTTDSIDTDGTKNSCGTNGVGAYATATCTITGISGKVAKDDKLKIIPMIKLDDNSLQGCSADTAKEFVITLV